ncbi:hypothetical protein HOW07_14280 [Plantibacter sp. MCCC 1A11337]|uniref:hypothetical protein n=1 Tax=Plantibacter sp. MCCC 1A11337 TaxID=2736644 RepID=UPI001582F3C5|nr:hypothetical protein [Plantibacter sp. MCCC 1A11337]NUJ89177.1 hypothetical protein [Plantibacter sp. MCCC 1A11337]
MTPTERFYSDRKNGPRARSHKELPEATSNALQSLVRQRLQSNWLAQEFPSHCPDGNAVVDTNQYALAAELAGLFAGVEWPLWQETPSEDTLFDVIEYVGRRVSKPIEGGWHEYMKHFELSFDKKAGQAEYRSAINLLLSRGGTVFELTSQMIVQRVGSPETHTALRALRPNTGDTTLDSLIEEGRTKYLSRHSADRATAIEKLWDGFERLKTIDVPGDKKTSVQVLLAHIVDLPFRAVIEAEMQDLTKLGNSFQIRHHETGKSPIPPSAQDYVMGRMANLLIYLLDQSGRLLAPGV